MVNTYLLSERMNEWMASFPRLKPSNAFPLHLEQNSNSLSSHVKPWMIGALSTSPILFYAILLPCSFRPSFSSQIIQPWGLCISCPLHLGPLLTPLWIVGFFSFKSQITCHLREAILDPLTPNILSLFTEFIPHEITLFIYVLPFIDFAH